MPRSTTTHIQSAIKLIDKAMSEIKKSKKTTDVEFGKTILALEKAIINLRNTSIKFELNQGLSGALVAARYGLTAGRISQIKNC